MATITVDVDAAAASAAMALFAARGTADLMETLGALVEGQTKRRFNTKISPDGQAWAPLKPLTLAARKHGGSSQLQDTGRLMGSISHTSSSTQAIVGTNVFYAPYHQYGVASIKPKKGKFLRVPLRGGGAALLKGSSIPARPFLGISGKDMAEIKAAVDAWVETVF